MEHCKILDGLHRTSLAPKVEKAAIYSASGDHVVVASPDFAVHFSTMYRGNGKVTDNHV